MEDLAESIVRFAEVLKERRVWSQLAYGRRGREKKRGRESVDVRRNSLVVDLSRSIFHVDVVQVDGERFGDDDRSLRKGRSERRRDGSQLEHAKRK